MAKKAHIVYFLIICSLLLINSQSFSQYGDIRFELLSEENGITGINGGRFFTNAIDTWTQGLDIVLKTGLDIGLYQNFTFTSGLNLSSTVVKRIASPPPQLIGFEESLFGRQSLGRIEKSQPAHKLLFMLNYNFEQFSFMVRTNWFGLVTLFHPSNPDRDQTLSSKWITDLDISYSINKNMTISFGSNNIFDVYPDKNIPFTWVDTVFPYSDYSPFGYNVLFTM